MAVRLGVLKFRGYKLKKTPVTGIAALTDADFKPDFEQKGVDMRIGLDIAVLFRIEMCGQDWLGYCRYRLCARNEAS